MQNGIMSISEQSEAVQTILGVICLDRGLYEVRAALLQQFGKNTIKLEQKWARQCPYCCCLSQDNSITLLLDKASSSYTTHAGMSNEQVTSKVPDLSQHEVLESQNFDSPDRVRKGQLYHSLFVLPRIAFNRDILLPFIAKLPLIIGVFFQLG